jgi:dihydroorotate dehydrogenase (NAD+) catalytic subunit
MIEIAPNHKYGLSLKGPVMPAAGTFGFGDAYPNVVDLSLLGAIVTNPVSLRRRRAARGRRLAVHQDVFVVHTGWPNPGIRRVVRDFREIWAHLPTPVIIHLLASQPAELARAASGLSGVRNVAGIELGFSTGVSPRLAVELLDAAREGDLPVIAKVPFERVDQLAPHLARHGVDAVTLMSPPRAVLPLTSADEASPVARYLRGRLYGRALFPLLLNAVSRWAGKLGCAVIACGGIASPQEALACINLGAAAVQIDALLWRDPSLLNDIARALGEPQMPAQPEVVSAKPEVASAEPEAGLQEESKGEESL